MAFVITVACIDVKDRSCIDECPVDCIFEGLRMLYIQPEQCIDCAACVPVCPVDAIYRDEELPEELEHYIEVNAEFFGDAVTGLGATASAYRIGRLEIDHPLVASHVGPDS